MAATGLAIQESPLAQQLHTAAVLAIGTANPANCLHQDEYPDGYFGVTKSDHLITLKN
jgi:chalcone synthase